MHFKPIKYIQPYRGYANHDRLFLKGRVLKHKRFRKNPVGRFRIFMDTFHRFDSNEMGGVEVRVTVGENYFVAITDSEGYFKINAPWQSVPEPPTNLWLQVSLELADEKTKATADIHFPHAEPSFGILSDVDDTVLQTDMNSWLKLKMLYNTFFKNARQRRPMEGMPDLLNALIRGRDGKRENPIFYVSDSPWNIYDILIDFMNIQNLPKGPLLLRDYGRQMIFNRKLFDSHKVRAISQILETYPGLPFIMFGDTASHDADHYLHFAKKHPGRIRAIYIRFTQDTKNARRVASLIEAHSDIDAILVRSSGEMLEHARDKGFLE